MISYLTTSIFDSDCQTLVNPVNCVGVMGAGLAKQFKDRYPEMFEAYRRTCNKKALQPGDFIMWGGHNFSEPEKNKRILCFPTKVHWLHPSRPEYIREGLKAIRYEYEDLEITSIAMPALGCGLGGLKWDEVKPLIEGILGDLPIRVDVHLPEAR